MSRPISTASTAYYVVKPERVQSNTPAKMPGLPESSAASIARDNDTEEIEYEGDVARYHERTAEVADIAIDGVNRTATAGSNRRHDSSGLSQAEVYQKVMEVRTTAAQLYKVMPQGEKMSRSDSENWCRSTSLAFEHLGYGHCGEMACHALVLLLDADVRPLDLVQTTLNGHQLCAIGRKKDSDPNDMTTWGDHTYFVDPWARKKYPISSFSEMQRPDYDVQYSEGYRQDQLSATGSLPPPYLAGTLKSIARFD